MDARLKSVWIAGAGYLGHPLAQQLAAQGYDVVASSRHESSGLNWQYWDFQDALPVQNFQQADVWVVLLPPSGAVDYVAQMQVLCEQAQAANIAHVVYTSSTSVYGDAARVCDEHSAVDPQTESAHKIVACENLWLQSGLPNVSILRLGGLYDDERHPAKRLSGRVDIAGGNQVVNIVHRQHAVQALLDVINQPKESVLNIVECEHPTRAEFYTAEAARLGLPVPVFNVDDANRGKVIVSCHQHWSF